MKSSHSYRYKLVLFDSIEQHDKLREKSVMP